MPRVSDRATCDGGYVYGRGRRRRVWGRADMCLRGDGLHLRDRRGRRGDVALWCVPHAAARGWRGEVRNGRSGMRLRHHHLHLRARSRRRGSGRRWLCVTPPPACPSTEPASGGTCTAGTGGFAGCIYTAGTCNCRPPVAGAMGDTWECAPACPTTEPAAASSCTAGTGGGAGCAYGPATCHCRARAGAEAGAGDVWVCG